MAPPPEALSKPGGETFGNITTNNPAGVSMSSDVTVNTSLTLTSGAFSIGANTLTLNGSLQSGGGSLAGSASSNLVVPGTGGKLTLPGVTLKNLTLNGTSGDSLSGDVTVNGAAVIANETLHTGSSALILGPSGTLSEPIGLPVAGVVRTTRTVSATSGSEAFGGIGVELGLNGTAPGNTTVIRKTGTSSAGSSHTSIARYFDIRPSNNTGLNADLVFHYDTTELNGQNAGALELYRSRDNGTTWNNLGAAVNAASHTISLTGLSDFSRWTAADTNNRLGGTATPTTTSLTPSARIVGSSGFTLAVHGTEFINGKSTIQFNGASKPTTFVNSTQLTTPVLASELLTIGSTSVTVLTTGGGGLSNAQSFRVDPIPPSVVRIETAADGSGNLISARSIAAGSSLTVYAVTRDSLNGFFANVAADAWTLQILPPAWWQAIRSPQRTRRARFSPRTT